MIDNRQGKRTQEIAREVLEMLEDRGVPELFEISEILKLIPEASSTVPNLDDTTYWKREVFPVLRRLKPYRLRRSRRKPQPRFAICGRAPEGKVRLNIQIVDPVAEPAECCVDLKLVELIRDKGYVKSGCNFWNTLPLVNVEQEIEELFGSREDWMLLNNQKKIFRVKLSVPYTDKEEAKALGALWDPKEGTWWVSELDYCAEIDKKRW